jgi:hypothetical protein
MHRNSIAVAVPARTYLARVAPSAFARVRLPPSAGPPPTRDREAMLALALLPQPSMPVWGHEAGDAGDGSRYGRSVHPEGRARALAMRLRDCATA